MDSGLSPTDKTPFEGTWERVRNEMTRWTFAGNAYEVYDELASESGDHYHKGTFIFKEDPSKNRGMIEFRQTHSAKTSGAWTPNEEYERTTYKFVNDTTLEISSARYRKK
jgi:hypothetical protein